MERLFGLFYIISIPLWIVYVCIDSIDKNLFKRRKRYIVFHELVFLSLGIWAVHENSDRNWIVPVVVVAEILVFFLYDLIRQGAQVFTVSVLLYHMSQKYKEDEPEALQGCDG